MANGEEVHSQSIGTTDNWTFTWTNLPVYSDGEAIVYTVEEAEVEGYTTVIEALGDNVFEIRNIHEPAPTTTTEEPTSSTTEEPTSSTTTEEPTSSTTIEEPTSTTTTEVPTSSTTEEPTSSTTTEESTTPSIEQTTSPSSEDATSPTTSGEQITQTGESTNKQVASATLILMGIVLLVIRKRRQDNE